MRHLRCRGRLEAAIGRSIFVGQHHGDHADRDGRVGRIGGVVVQAAIKIIDLEKDRVAFGLERPKVVLFMRVVGVAEVVKPIFYSSSGVT
jgi:hypothetical protein